MSVFYVLDKSGTASTIVTNGLIALDNEAGVQSEPTGFLNTDAQLGYLFIDGVMLGKIEWKLDGKGGAHICWLAAVHGFARELWTHFELVMKTRYSVKELTANIVFDTAEQVSNGVRRINLAFAAGFRVVDWQRENSERTIFSIRKALN
jgi:hypothetical protein